MTPDEAAEHLLARASWRWSRASGPGGQHRDHAETRAELRLGPDALEGLPEPVAARLAAALRLEERPLRMTSQAERSRERNRAIVTERLRARVIGALAPAPPPRRPTRPTAGARERRLAGKAQRSALKASRRPPAVQD
jgi:ribosome-associated protein